ncbi:MAG: hypothetical protein JNK48_27830 [Bryobacterales bacterium]|nr:hypothetical protein [Bryobacterales bacterium]
MLLAACAILVAGAILLTLGVREKDLPPPSAESPVQHLEERKAQIYENLRDLQFEYRVGKLSDEDYAKTKTELQTELAKVMSAIDQTMGATPAAAKVEAEAKPEPGTVCPHCKARFEKALKFCGECGKAMVEGAV